LATVQTILPDQLAQEAQSAGLLASASLEGIFRELLKTKRAEELFPLIDRMVATPERAITPEEVADELRAVRAQRRGVH
jgi:hypothetical protein